MSLIGFFVGQTPVYGDTAGCIAAGRIRRQGPITLFVLLSLCLCIGGVNAQIVKINFQPAEAPVPVGYLPDTGDVFANRGNGYSYGFNAPTPETRQRDLYSEPRYNTFNHLQKSSSPNATWEIALPNATYVVHLVCGDPSFTNQFNAIEVEGEVFPDSSLSNFDEYDLTVTLNDGRLTIRPAPGAINAKICFVDIQREGSFNEPPWVNVLVDDAAITWPGERRVQLDAEVYDDDPNEAGPPTLEWSKVSGPGSVTFIGGTDIADPEAAFTAPGTYTLRLEATDELDQTGMNTVLISVDEAVLVGDVDGDGDVDIDDVRIMAQRWLGPGNNTADLDGNDTIAVGDLSRLAGNWGRRTSPVKINEFMATNSYTPPVSSLDIYTRFDSFGGPVRPDWIEFHNSNPDPVSLAGWYLTDDRDNPQKWRFPAGASIAADGYLVVFASNKEQVDYPDNYPFVDYDGALHTNFELAGGGEYLALVRPDGMIAHEYDEYPEQRGLISYGIASDGKVGYLLNPTPGLRVGDRWRGAANSARYLGVVADTKFSRNRGFCDSPFDVTISCATANSESGVEIRYTLDGSTPTPAHGQTHAGPIRISTTTCLRAAAFKTGWLATNVDTQTYIFLDDVLQQATDSDTGSQITPEGCPDEWKPNAADGSYGHLVDGYKGDYQVDPEVVAMYSDTIRDDLTSIPTLSIVMDRDDWFGDEGIYVHESLDGQERRASAELIDPAGGDEFQLNCGVRMQGGVSGGGTSLSRWKSYKLSMRLVFRGGYGPSKLRFPLLGEHATDSFDTVVLEARLNNVWNHPSSSQQIKGQYTRDQYPSDVQIAMGGYGTHGRPVHLYISGLYWGLYWIHERPDENFAAAYLGGDPYDYDVLKHDHNNVVNGTDDNYDEMFTVPASDLDRIGEYLHLNDFIDYMIMNFYVGNTDWSHKNWYASRNRKDPEGRWRYHSWDAEHCLKSLGEDVTTRNNASSPTGMHQKLKSNPEYRLMFADRLHKHFFNDGVLTPAGAEALYQNLLDQIDRAVVGESVRWGDNRRSVPYTRDVEWVNQRDWLLGTYFPHRTSEVLDQLDGYAGLYPGVAAPSFSKHGGSVPLGFPLEITAPAGTIYYTLDGSDPRRIGGAAVGTLYSDSIPLAKSAVVKARVLSGSTWSALNEATFAAGPVLEKLRITELMYHPTDPTQAEKDAAGDQNLIDEDFEYIELKNTGAAAINLNLVNFTDGIDFTFGDYSLDWGQFALVVKNQAAFQARYPGVSPSLITGTYTGALSNSGEEIVLRDAVGTEIHDFDFNDTWFVITDGGGYSLNKLDPDTASNVAPDSWNRQSGWRPGSVANGTPGAPDTGYTLQPADVVISEIMTHTDDVVHGDWIEIWNRTQSPVYIGGWFLSDNENDLRKYEIAAGDPRAMIDPNSYVVFDSVNDFRNPGDPGSNEQFGLSEHGEDVYLTSGADGELTGQYSTEQEDFGAAESGTSIGMYFKSVMSSDEEDFVRLLTVTRGDTNNNDPIIGPVVISEIMYNPQDPDNDTEAEYIELTNLTGSTVYLYDPANPSNTWQIKGVSYAFPQGVTLSANETILVTRGDPTQFRATYGIPVGIDIYGAYSGALNNGGEKVTLIQPGAPDPLTFEVPQIRIDRVNYDDSWYPATDGGGKSLTRKVLSEYGNDIANWQAANPTPGW